MNIARTAILGAGAWGTALAWLWGKDGRQISLWAHNVDRVRVMQKTRENSDHLPGLKLPESVEVTSELTNCARADLIVFVTPSTALREIAGRLRKVIGNEGAIFLSCTKGIEHRSGMRMSQILGEAFPEQRVAVLSGPNLAVEIAQNLPTATVIASDDVDCAASLQGVLGSPRFRIYTSRDVVSVELGGALKNVFAIAAGISDGLGLGDNSKAALVTRSLAELVRLGTRHRHIGGIARPVARAPPLGVVDEVLERLARGALGFEEDELPRDAGLHTGGGLAAGRVGQADDDRLLVRPTAQRSSAGRVVGGVLARERQVDPELHDRARRVGRGERAAAREGDLGIIRQREARAE